MNDDTEFAGIALQDERIHGRNIALRLASVEDAAFINGLRRDEERNRYISRVDDDVAAQAKWLAGYKVREAKGEEYYFIIELADGTPVGTVRIYDYRGDSFSWGSWVIAPGTPPTVAMESALLVYEFAFGPLGFKRCHFQVRKGNERVSAFHKRFGAQVVSENDLEYEFTYSREGYAGVRPRYAKFLPEEPES
jgi:RimJ/RimL family protein N-acetyltransferase